MHPETEAFFHPRRQAPGAQLRLNGQEGLTVRDDRLGDFMRPARPRLGRHQAGQAAGGKRRRRLVKRRAREPEALRRFGHGEPIVGDPAQHLILDLDEIPRIEERPRVVKKGVGNPVGMRVPGPRLAEPRVLVVGGQGARPPLGGVST